METGAQGLGDRQAIGIEGEVWFDSGSLRNPRRRSLSEELSQVASMQPMQRSKRQHCGNYVQDEQYHNLVFGSSGHSGSGSATMPLEASMSNHSSGLVFPGAVHEQYNRVNTANYSTPHSEVGSSSNLVGLTLSSDIAATGACWSAGSLQHRVSNAMEGHTNNLYPHVGVGSWSLHNRKSSIDGLASVLPCTAAFERRESDIARFPQGPPELLRSNTTANVSTFDNLSAWDGAQLGRDNHNHSGYHSLRVHRLPRQTASRSRAPSSIYGASDVASHPGLPRRRQANGLVNDRNISIGLPESVASGGNHGLSAAVSWHGDNIYRDQNSNTSSLMGRGEVNSLSDLGSLQINHVSGAPQNRVQLVNRSTISAHLIESTAHVSHHPYALGGQAYLQPSTRPPTLPRSRINNPNPRQGLLMIPSSGSMFGQHQTHVYQPPQAAMAPMIPRTVELNRALPSRRVSFRGAWSLPSAGSNHYQPASYGFLERVPSSNGIEWADIYDEHSNMRMDVDNMSYEELLALEERIGNVNTGISEEDIEKCLETSVHACVDATLEESSQDGDSNCSICQEEYMEGDELGRLNCGHGYHTACIKQWLVLKNQCPICKAAAYPDS